MSRYIHAMRCTIEVHAGEFCDLPRAKGMPFPICFEHALRVYQTMTEMIEIFSNGNSIMSRETAHGFIDNVLAQAKAKNNTPMHRVYYLKVGDLIKIGTTRMGIKTRMNAYPPNSELLAVERGGTEVEARRHRQFRHLLAERKEWFHPGADLLDHIAQLGAPAI